jgi:hypothetical protein
MENSQTRDILRPRIVLVNRGAYFLLLASPPHSSYFDTRPITEASAVSGLVRQLRADEILRFAAGQAA